MNSADVIGYVSPDSGLYCRDCGDADWYPVFADSETDSPSHCEACEAYIDESLTPHGVQYVVDALAANLTYGDGRPEILDEWAEALTWYSLDEESAAIVEVYRGFRAGT